MDEQTVDVEDILVDNRLALLLYPNPASAYLNVFMNSAPQGEIIYVFDIHGNIVLTYIVEGAMTTLPVQSLAAGMYIVQVGKRVGKFFKE